MWNIDNETFIKCNLEIIKLSKAESNRKFNEKKDLSNQIII